MPDVNPPIPTPQPAGAGDAVGKPIDRADGRLKVTGAARYTAEWPAADVAHAAAFISTIAKGKVTTLDTEAAEKSPGVLAVLTYHNANTLTPVDMENKVGKPGQTFLPLQDDTVRYAGQFLGLVIALTLEQAAHAAGLVKIAYAEEKPALKLEEALDRKFTPKKMGRGDKPDTSRGDPDGALATAPVKVVRTYVTPVEHHNPMETSATVAAWEGGRLSLFDSTQWVLGSRSVAAKWLGVAEDSVRVICRFLGGGFGCKGSIWPHVGLTALAAKRVGRPVKFSLTRQQMFGQIGYRPRTIQSISLGATRDGKLTAIVHDTVAQTSSWKDEWTEPAGKQTRLLYACPNVRTTHRLAPLDVNTPTQMRAPGHASGTFALESAMDELAYALKIDPVELRLRNFVDKDEDEDKPFSSKALKECYAQGASRFGWERRTPEPRSLRDGKYLVGLGMATATYPTNWSPSSAKVRLLPEGRAVVSAASHDLGTGTYTILAQIAADALGLAVEKVKVDLGDTHLPEAPVAGGSQTAVSVGCAVKRAADEARAKLVDLAVNDERSPLRRKKPEEIAAGGGRLFLKADPAVGETWPDLFARAAADAKPGLEVTAKAEPDAEAKKHSRHSHGAQFVEVRVDPDLGEIRVKRAVGAFAAGRILNAKTGRSQVLGGIVWGIGMALHEETHYDPRHGKIVNDNLADYLVPVNADVPPVEAFFVDEPDPHVNPLGAKGIGELGITGAAAAVANAVYHATGKRVRGLPITVEKVL